MNTDQNMESARAPETTRPPSAVDQQPPAGGIAVSYRPCELFEGGLGI